MSQMTYAEQRNARVRDLILDRELASARGRALENRVMDFENTCLQGISLSGARIFIPRASVKSYERRIDVTTNFTGCDLRFADFSGADAQRAGFEKCNMCFAFMAAADLRGANFKGASLAGADFAGAALEGAQFTLDPGLLTANFKGATGINKAKFYTTNMKNGKVQEIEIIGAAIDEEGCLIPSLANPADIFNTDSPIENHFVRFYRSTKQESDAAFGNMMAQVRQLQEQRILPAHILPPQHFVSKLSLARR